jgi:hypothetical protein
MPLSRENGVSVGYIVLVGVGHPNPSAWLHKYRTLCTIVL